MSGEDEEDAHASDVRLAAACARGDDAALAAFDRRFLSQVPAYVSHMNASPAFATEIQQRLRIKLLVSEGSAPPKIAGYTGKGPLAAWVRIAAVRAGRDLLRGPKSQSLGEDSKIPSAPAHRDPEVEYMKRHYAGDFARAFKKTLAALSEKQRNILCLYYLEEMSSAAIGKLYGVEGATVRLWIKQYRQTLLDEVRKQLGERFRIPSSELDSVVRLVQSRLDLSITSILRDR